MFYLRYLRQISKLTEEIEDRLRHDMKNSEILRLLQLQKGLTYSMRHCDRTERCSTSLMRLRTNTSLHHYLSHV